MNSEGFFSIHTMLSLLAMSLLLFGISIGVSLTMDRLLKKEHLKNEEDALRTEIDEIIVQLEEDPTPASDAYNDPVWTYIRNQASKYERLELRDLSSYINLNWTRTVFIERTELRKFLIDGAAAGNVKSRRSEIGFVLDLNKYYSDFIKTEALDAYFTSYGYLNVNTAYEYVLKDMYAALTEDSGGAESFHSFIARNLSAKHIITEEELAAELPATYQKVFPLIGTLPSMNVHFVPEFLLEQVLRYPYGEEPLENATTVINTLLSLRDGVELLPEDLHSLIDAEGLQKRILHHLGTKTWFWQVNIVIGKTAAEAVIVCLPKQNEDTYHYRLYSFATHPRESK